MDKPASMNTGIAPAPSSRPDGVGRAMTREWRQSWRPGVASLLGAAVGLSVWATVSSMFIGPLQQAFGWSRGDISFAFNAGLVAAFCAPPLGRLVDRAGVRPVLVTGLLLTMACYGLFALMRGSLGYYYAVYLAFNVAGMATTGITYTRVITGAFHATRGSALAISRSGLALSGALLPVLLYATIDLWGFQGGYLTLAALIGLVALPLAWFWIPSTPARSRHPTELALDRSESWATLLRQPKVLLLCLASALNLAPVVALMSQLMPLAQSKGLAASEAVGAISVVGIAAFGGALLSGVLVDRFWAPMVAFTLNIGPALGCLLLLQGDVSPLLFYAAMLLLGLGQGAEIDIVAFMIARYFGLRSYASIYGLSVLAIAISVALGAAAIGKSYDLFGSYDAALMAASGSFLLAAICYLMMGRYPANS